MRNQEFPLLVGELDDDHAVQIVERAVAVAIDHDPGCVHRGVAFPRSVSPVHDSHMHQTVQFSENVNGGVNPPRSVSAAGATGTLPTGALKQQRSGLIGTPPPAHPPGG